jgi:hypothetical protein
MPAVANRSKIPYRWNKPDTGRPFVRGKAAVPRTFEICLTAQLI